MAPIGGPESGKSRNPHLTAVERVDCATTVYAIIVSRGVHSTLCEDVKKPPVQYFINGSIVES